MMSDPIPKEDLEFARRAFVIRIAAALLDARHYAHTRGHDDYMCAALLGMSTKEWRGLIANPDTLTLNRVSDIALSCGCHLELTVRADRTALPASPTSGEAEGDEG